jgi:SAM-dependent methyltransferase
LTTLREAWDQQAEGWIGWAREPRADHWGWNLAIPALLDLLPAPGRLTVEVGCGEGRVSRELLARGHRVVAFDASERMVQAARASEPTLDARVADATALPLADGAADLVVAAMVLISLDDAEGAVAEASRVLEPGGRLCLSTVHPANSHDLADPPPTRSYFDTYRFQDTRERAGQRITFHDVHRPLEAYSRALEAAGLLIEAIREPVPDDAHVEAHPDAAEGRRRPMFLHLKAVKR